MTVIPTIKPKNDFELALSKLDLQGCLMLMAVLSEKALSLNAVKKTKTILDAKGV